MGIANFITVLRMAGTGMLLFTAPLTPAFYLLYTLCGVTDALDGIIAYTDLPLKLPMYAGGLFTAMSAVLAVVLLILELNKQAMGLWWIACLLLFFGGLILVGQGLLGRYLGKIHTQVKQRPIYIAKEILTYEKD